MRSDSAYTEMTMEIVTPDWRRSLSLRSWDDRHGKRSFIHILSHGELVGLYHKE